METRNVMTSVMRVALHEQRSSRGAPATNLMHCKCGLRDGACGLEKCRGCHVKTLKSLHASRLTQCLWSQATAARFRFKPNGNYRMWQAGCFLYVQCRNVIGEACGRKNNNSLSWKSNKHRVQQRAHICLHSSQSSWLASWWITSWLTEMPEIIFSAGSPLLCVLCILWNDSGTPKPDPSGESTL